MTDNITKFKVLYKKKRYTLQNLHTNVNLFQSMEGGLDNFKKTRKEKRKVSLQSNYFYHSSMWKFSQNTNSRFNWHSPLKCFHVRKINLFCIIYVFCLFLYWTDELRLSWPKFDCFCCNWRYTLSVYFRLKNLWKESEKIMIGYNFQLTQNQTKLEMIFALKPIIGEYFWGIMVVLVKSV